MNKVTDSPPSPLATTLANVLGQFGIASSTDHEEAERLVEAELRRIGVPASFASLRHGELTLEAKPQAAALLRYDTERLAAALDESLPGVVTSIKIRPRR